MGKTRHKKFITSLMVMLLAISVVSSFGQSPAVTREPSQRSNSKPLSEKENPLMIGRRDINRRQIDFFSRRREIALGRQLAAEVDRQVQILDEPVISEYVNRIGQNLVMHSDAADIPFTIKVVASDEVNAFALPGGFLYVNTGVLQGADNESELAGVMAHEIAHVAARHAMENVSKGQLLSYGSIALIFVGGGLGTLARNGANLGLSAALFSFSRKAEREADSLGAQYLWAAGYDPNGMRTFFEKLQAGERRPTVSPLFRTHPATPDRIAAQRQLVARFPERENSVISTSDFAQAKARLLALSGGGRQAEQAAQSGGRPTLRRRPADGQADDASTGSTQDEHTSSSASGARQSSRLPPVLQRRSGEEPPPPQERREPPTLRRRAP